MWPEEGKIPFVYRSLSQKSIPHAELIAYSREDAAYPNGYLIERGLPGTAADQMRLDREQEIKLYAKLAELVSSVHEVCIENYGNKEMEKRLKGYLARLCIAIRRIPASE
ncbi:MAG: hypothetical protein J5898_02995 [Lachnospiraceae bacterium]|nr:hypothetical protein [Lachnospiraceae bacterium]